MTFVKLIKNKGHSVKVAPGSSVVSSQPVGKSGKMLRFHFCASIMQKLSIKKTTTVSVLIGEGENAGKFKISPDPDGDYKLTQRVPGGPFAIQFGQPKHIFDRNYKNARTTVEAQIPARGEPHFLVTLPPCGSKRLTTDAGEKP